MKNELLYPAYLKKKITNIIGNTLYNAAIDFNKYTGFITFRQWDDATEDVYVELVFNINYGSFKGNIFIIYQQPTYNQMYHVKIN